jgi:ribosomal protein L7/L12
MLNHLESVVEATKECIYQKDMVTAILLRRAARRLLDKEFVGIETVPQSCKLTDNEIYTGKHVGKVAAIKDYRNRTNRSLVECKRAVEKHFADNCLNFHYAVPF